MEMRFENMVWNDSVSTVFTVDAIVGDERKRVKFNLYGVPECDVPFEIRCTLFAAFGNKVTDYATPAQEILRMFRVM